MSHALPKISCLTVTFDRLVLLKEAIRCYCDQTYPSRELVIVTAGAQRYRQAIADYIDALGRSDIRAIFLGPGQYTLAQARNAALDTAGGDILCQWDDDDLYHPERLRVQAERLLSAQAAACFMTDYLQFFHEERLLFWVDWSQDGAIGGTRQLIPNTLMMFADARVRYREELNSGEDSALIDDLHGAGLAMAGLRGAGQLYVYRYHGRNTLPKTHHHQIAGYSCREGFFQQHQAALQTALRYYRLPMPYQVMDGQGRRRFVYNG
jgi:glycosyltransferase involved in cell wall biosynthesis